MGKEDNWAVVLAVAVVIVWEPKTLTRLSPDRSSDSQRQPSLHGEGRGTVNHTRVP